MKASALAFAELGRVASDQIVLIVDFVFGVDVKLVALLSTVSTTF